MTRPFRLLMVRVAILVVIVVAALAVVPRQRLIIAARSDRASYGAGEPVTVSVVLAIGASEPVSIRSLCGPYQLGFSVADERGDVVYSSFNPGAVYSCPDSIPIATLQPGWTESRSFTWTQVDGSGNPVAPGHSYAVLPALLFGTPSVAPVTAGSQIFAG